MLEQRCYELKGFDHETRWLRQRCRARTGYNSHKRTNSKAVQSNSAGPRLLIISDAYVSASCESDSQRAGHSLCDYSIYIVYIRGTVWFNIGLKQLQERWDSGDPWEGSCGERPLHF